jgi:hypothetical protein
VIAARGHSEHRTGGIPAQPVRDKPFAGQQRCRVIAGMPGYDEFHTRGQASDPVYPGAEEKSDALAPGNFQPSSLQGLIMPGPP